MLKLILYFCSERPKLNFFMPKVKIFNIILLLENEYEQFSRHEKNIVFDSIWFRSDTTF